MSRYVLTLIVVATAFATTGCAAIRRYNDGARSEGVPARLQSVNERLKGRWALVTLTDGRVYGAFNVRIERDETYWQPPRVRHTRRVETSQVARVEIRKRTLSYVPGLVLGAVLTSLAVRQFGGSSVPAVFLSGAIGGAAGGVLSIQTLGKNTEFTFTLVYQGPIEAYLDEDRS